MITTSLKASCLLAAVSALNLQTEDPQALEAMLLAEVGHEAGWPNGHVRWCRSPWYADAAYNAWLNALDQYGRGLGNCLTFE